MIVIVDYGMGNLGSIANMLKKVGADCQVSSSADVIEQADKIILPGVGAFDAAMERVNASGLRPVLERKALQQKVPVLGICLGMQLLTESSEEGRLAGLGWIPARTLAFRERVDAGLKVPHMGWNLVSAQGSSPLTQGLDRFVEPRFYFVHSFFVECSDERHTILKTTYGVTCSSGIQKDNIFGLQFHPEKSHRFGMLIMENFARL